MTHMSTSDPHLTAFRSFITPLSSKSHKGQGGKVAVIGGCLEYTGAPYFASMSSLRAGADLSYVICTPSAATPLKSLSPELMVLPYLPERTSIFNGGWTSSDVPFISKEEVRSRSENIVKWIRRANVVVIGPGLGDDPHVNAVVREVIKTLYPAGAPEDHCTPALVIDGSALRQIAAEDPRMLIGIRKCVLTPNLPELKAIGEAILGKAELARLLDNGGGEGRTNEKPKGGEAKLGEEMQLLGAVITKAFRGPVIVAKGSEDHIYSLQSSSASLTPSPSSSLSTPGVCLTKSRSAAGLKRCGGQGDLLAGTIGTFLCWALRGLPLSEPSVNIARDDVAERNDVDLEHADEISRRVALAAYAASFLIRTTAASVAEESEGERGVVAGDFLGKIPATFKKHLEL
eukprot:CAMPEP_0175077046 /NCGR_PEP_ID=MMETSP0052_2-20121109/23133_1 /TAXON_ID=51329 ORGANISM="Polytomella parva, Strain SAG 63-3" /NCGR_SAMPLE_ID=MMETSP0052_2 /ASSEMBLY_ACC=CAM_ASM_000194 /LENGTH=401 /DNA_ID=CAMNT_0016346389 /DNA_START=145 /DNA_END=1350 /DNA_ORIENTATION=-